LRHPANLSKVGLPMAQAARRPGVTTFLVFAISSDRIVHIASHNFLQVSCETNRYSFPLLHHHDLSTIYRDVEGDSRQRQ